RLRESVSPALDRVLQRLLAKSPADRYASAAELSAALAGLNTAEDGTAAVPVSPSKPRSARRTVLTRTALLAVLIGGLAAAWIARRPRRAEVALDPASVAVLPFRVTASDHSLDYLGEGIVDLLAVKLDGSAGVRAVPPRQVLAALRYQPGTTITEDDAGAAARRTGAGRILDGSLVRSAAGLELSAVLRRTDGGGAPVRAAVSGSPDSLPVLVDRLAAQLLASQGGAIPSLSQISSAGALSAYLRGKAADREGRFTEAVADFGQALDQDSTFALAALDQMGSAQRTGDQPTSERASRLAWAHRERLTPKGRILLRAMVGPRYPEPSSQIALLAAWQDAVTAMPEVPDAWFQLGDIQLHNGGLNDVPAPVEHAEQSFGRALELDSTWELPLNHILLAKLHLEDTTDFRALARRWFALDTAQGDRSAYLRWRFALALGDSAIVARERAGLERWNSDALLWLAGDAQAEAVGLGDVPLAIRELTRRAVTGPKLWNARVRRREWLLNSGRPAEALALTDSLASGEPWAGWARVTTIEDAVFWDGDTAAAAAAVRRLAAALGGRSSAARLAPDVRSRTTCRLGLWSLARGDQEGVRRWAGRLREPSAGGSAFSADDGIVCATLLQAWLAWRERQPEVARRLLDRADSMFIASDVFVDWPLTNLVTARLREATGDVTGAARAIGRVEVALPVSPTYRSSYLREQARIGLELGDTAGAVRALRRYVALRADAEPALRAGADSARARLAGLVGR
ncbi:MAG TPA: hypothetical protein VFN08_09955, partial [Gemmatimonadales bacterium]|nr:hypothetical protein [Gemmatimonadales bacterium]